MDAQQLLSLLQHMPAGPAVPPNLLRVGLGLATGPLFGLGALGALYAPSLLHLRWLRREVEERLDLTTQLPDGREVERSPMQWRADRLAASSQEAPLPWGGVAREADHLFLGTEPHASIPILLSLEALAEHMFITGQSGSGKTSKLMLPLALQAASRDLPVIFLDLKGDWATFQTLRATVPPERFRFFTLDRLASDVFNPFSSLDMHERSPGELSELVIEALSLAYGETYGRSYFGQGNRAALKAALQYLKHKDPRWPHIGFREIYAALIALGKTPKAQRKRDPLLQRIVIPDGMNPEERNPLELLGRIMSLASFDQLCLNPASLTSEQRARAITMSNVIEQRQVVYLFLPQVLQSSVTRSVTLLALYSLWYAATHRTSQHQIYVFCDEVQRIASVQFGTMLAQARDPGRMSLIMSCQTEAQLQDADVDMRPLINAATRVRAYFAIDDPKIAADLIARSGEEIEEYTDRSSSMTVTSDGTTSVTTGERVRTLKAPRLKRDDIDFLRDNPNTFILHCSRGAGYMQYGGHAVPVLTTWALPKALYDERSRPGAWPEPLPGQVVGKLDPEDGNILGEVIGQDLTRAEAGIKSPSAASTAEAFEKAGAVAQEKLKALLEDAGRGKPPRRPS